MEDQVTDERGVVRRFEGDLDFADDLLPGTAQADVGDPRGVNEVSFDAPQVELVEAFGIVGEHQVGRRRQGEFLVARACLARQ